MKKCFLQKLNACIKYLEQYIELNYKDLQLYILVTVYYLYRFSHTPFFCYLCFLPLYISRGQSILRTVSMLKSITPYIFLLIIFISNFSY